MGVAAARWASRPQRPHFLIRLNISSYSAGFLGARPSGAVRPVAVWFSCLPLVETTENAAIPSATASVTRLLQCLGLTRTSSRALIPQSRSPLHEAFAQGSGGCADKTSSRAPGEYNGDTILGGKEIHVKAGDILS